MKHRCIWCRRTIRSERAGEKLYNKPGGGAAWIHRGRCLEAYNDGGSPSVATERPKRRTERTS